MNSHYLLTILALSMISTAALAAPKVEEDRNINVPTSENAVIRKMQNPDMPARDAIPDIDQTGNAKPVPKSKETSVQPHVFGNIDADKDGSVSREEFNATGDAAQFGQADADGNGSVSETEFNIYYNLKNRK